MNLCLVDLNYYNLEPVLACHHSINPIYTTVTVQALDDDSDDNSIVGSMNDDGNNDSNADNTTTTVTVTATTDDSTPKNNQDVSVTTASRSKQKLKGGKPAKSIIKGFENSRGNYKTIVVDG